MQLLEPYDGQPEPTPHIYAQRMHQHLCQQAAGRRIIATTTWRWRSLDGHLKTAVKTMEITKSEEFYSWFHVHHGMQVTGVTVFEALP